MSRDWKISSKHNGDCSKTRSLLIFAGCLMFSLLWPQFHTDVLDVTAVASKLNAMGYKVQSADPVFIPQARVPLNEMQLKTMDKFIAKVEESDAVMAIHSNM